ncbi:excinuclease ABC subunit UvrA [Anaerolentibacter hominis]|uniref:excinuclease ABC subunit UvrA n=1 Tax=Anaerolentibacter hominis TaxID=3079009 RepID=UPI0031B8181D
MADIQIINANEGNLKNISLNIPKNKLVVFTGLSGSGKSTLLVDVLFQECQRQYLEAMSLQGIKKPKVERIRGISPALLIAQTDGNKNPRSTVGTSSDIYTDLRMVYEKLGVRRCPFCGEVISAGDCKEETEKVKDSFYVYMYCCKCGARMDKITRTHFSFNTREGACPACEGLGKIHSVIEGRIIDETRSLEGGAVRYWEKQYGKYQLSILYSAYRYYGIPVPSGTPLNKLSKLQKAILLYGVDCNLVKETFPDQKPPKNTASGKFEGAIPILKRRFAEKGGDAGALDQYFDVTECPDCKGERLCDLSRGVTVNQTRLPELSRLSLEHLYRWIEQLEGTLSRQHFVLVESYLLDIKTKLSRFMNAGLNYLTLDRLIITLSGGELQRLRLAAVLDSDLTGVIYILDEPTAGLHPRDTKGLADILKKLRDLGNSVLVIEHDTDIMASADYIIDLGPGSGQFGGEVIAAGTIDEIRNQPQSVTGSYLNQPQALKSVCRNAAGTIRIRNADLYNLKQLNADIPVGCLTAVTGPSGSGKSTLIFEVLGKHRPGSKCSIVGLEQFESIVKIEQAAITGMRRSNIATYSGAYAEIRKLFAGTDAAKQAGLTSGYFSFNSPGGRCENCGGLGYIESNMLFFTNTEVVCPVCGGSQFDNKVLSVKYNGLSIKDVLNLSIEEACRFFHGHRKITRILKLLQDVGLGYLELGQTFTTLSGGEGQRLKLAKELIGSNSGRANLYLMDEPTAGLHPLDVEHFLVLLNRLTDAGNTVVVVEHNQQLIRNCDWIIDLGPDGGEKGGEVIFTGTPTQLLADSRSVTAAYLQQL